MLKKGLEAEASVYIEETPKLIKTADKPLKHQDKPSKKVDINILKARAQKIQDKENKKNISIFLFFLVIFSAVGIYLSV
tara:strand:+ start:566 stop:802 length:237 start_codon:yes stop_codon:yes gene_type:complete